MPLVRFDIFVPYSYPTKSDKFGGYAFMDQVPAVGELVNVDGEPYHVIERGWAVGKTCKTSEEAEDAESFTYCYLRIKGQ